MSYFYTISQNGIIKNTVNNIAEYEYILIQGNYRSSGQHILKIAKRVGGEMQSYGLF